MKYKEFLKVGFVQTLVESHVAWGKAVPFNHNMSEISEEKAWYEIKKGFIDLLNGYDKPEIIILPELSIPLCYESDVRKLCASSGAVVIGGLDFVWKEERVSNKAIISIPRNWPNGFPSKSTSLVYFGKTFYSKYEEQMFGRVNLVSHPDIFILDAAGYGKIGVAICSDFFDIERFIVYKGRIHHMIIIAHNQDTESYYYMAEAVARLVYCNVIICNTGEFGDSIAFSPYEKNFRRVIYRHKGAVLFSTQVVALPVKDLDDEQQVGKENKLFKGRPPGYRKS